MKEKKTYTLSEDAVNKLKELAENEVRPMSNMLEVLIRREHEIVKPCK